MPRDILSIFYASLHGKIPHSGCWYAKKCRFPREPAFENPSSEQTLPARQRAAPTLVLGNAEARGNLVIRNRINQIRNLIVGISERNIGSSGRIYLSLHIPAAQVVQPQSFLEQFAGALILNERHKVRLGRRQVAYRSNRRIALRHGQQGVLGIGNRSGGALRIGLGDNQEHLGSIDDVAGTVRIVARREVSEFTAVELRRVRRSRKNPNAGAAVRTLVNRL